MQPVVDDTQTIVEAGFAARKIIDGLDWGVGTIKPLVDQAGADSLVKASLGSMTAVQGDQQRYSACTDGRLPVRLLSGGPVPVREALVGADMVSAFYVAESLGDRFYKDPSAPVADRVREVAEFLQANDIVPSTHVGCGAAAGFVAITENTIKFAEDPRFVARQKALIPADVYDAALHASMLKANAQRLQSGVYEGLTGDVFLAVVEAVGGKQAIAELQDDGRGVHGHVEEAIMRVQVPGFAIDGAKLSTLTEGREVFEVNDTRIAHIAKLFGRGTDEDYRIAYMALEDFADCGHGTLAHALPTYIVTQA
ncbi:MAG: hypothetical protein ABWY71_02420 [Candidatus Saccharimonadales bacterium]